MEREYSDFLVREDLSEVDPDTDLIIGFEEERQAQKIILIPSESISPRAVRQALGSVFTNIYAEGYPPLRMTRDEEELLLNFGYELAYYRRYADRRFYKGCDYVHFLEALAQRRIARCFATDKISADEIYVNIQPLSGAAANNSVYEAFVEPGETVMGMALPHGGHLTHGSEFNRSGKRYHIVSYQADPVTERLDYDQIKGLAMEHKPKMIIAGYTSYPWAVDWERFREIADAIPGGAILLADVAHPAGMIVAGVYPTPIGYADVITFTTHKTICGPRGAVILTTDEEKAQLIDSAVFPGEQGGPHVNKFAAIAVAFKIAQTEKFRRLQERIVENAVALSDALEKRGLRIAYGGTNTHLLCIDLNAIPTKTGFPLQGETAARILDLCGIVVNKNTIPGDTSAADASGIRLGTPWVTQRGFGPEQMDKLAGLIHKVLTSIQPFSYIGLRGNLARGKIDLAIMEEVKRGVAELVAEAGDKMARESGYPHYYIPTKTTTQETPLLGEHRRLGAKMAEHYGWKMPLHYGDTTKEREATRSSAALFDLGDRGLLEISGERAKALLQGVTTNDVTSLEPGKGQRSLILEEKGRVMDDLLILRLKSDEWGWDHYLLITNPANTERVKEWLRALSDGYTLFDHEDVMAKIEGPAVVEDLKEGEEERKTALGMHGPRSLEILQRADAALPKLERFHAWEGEIAGIPALLFRTGYGGDDQRLEIILPQKRAPELWNLLLEEGLLPAGLQVREALREEVGLPSYDGSPVEGPSLYRGGYASLFALSKPYFVGQKAIVQEVKPKAEKRGGVPEPEEGEPRRTSLYPEHLKLTKKIIPFAGWEMPVWYTSIAEEHKAVRETAGLFDVGHMGVLEIAGPHATRFLDVVTSNYISWLKDGQSMYGYILDPGGRVMDDVMVYRRTGDLYMMVTNAVNQEKILAWLLAVNSREFLIDRDYPFREIEGSVAIRDLKDPSCGEEQRIDMALQGPNSLPILKRLIEDPRLERTLSRLRRSEFIETEILGQPLIISRTGYTGEEIGFEFYIRPHDAVLLWQRLLEVGEDLGIKPTGLGARDSTRTEAGLPLYGHELAGPHDISPLEAGYGPFVKFHKPFFIGRKPLLEKEAKREMEILRFRLNTRGGRMLKQGDLVVDKRGRYMGTVTSCALVDGYRLGMAYAKRKYHREGTQIGVFALPREGRPGKPIVDLALGDTVPLHQEATVLTRFPEPEERVPRPGEE